MPLDDVDAVVAAGIKQVRAANPNLGQQTPGLTLGLASTQDPVGNADQVSGLLDGQQILSQMHTLAPEDQATMFQSMPLARQTQLLAQGYHPDQATIDAGQKINEKHGFSLWHIVDDVWGAAGKVVKGAVGLVEHVPGVKEGLGLMAKPMQFLQRLERFGLLGLEDVFHPDRMQQFITPDGNLNGAGIGALWKASANGEKLIWDNKGIQSSLTEDQKHIALDEAFGMNQDQLAQKYDPRAVELARTAPGYGDFVGQLNDSKVSLGHLSAQLLGLHTGHLYHLVSGAVDAVADVATDPVNIAGSKIKNAREAYYTVKGPDALDSLYHQSSGIADTINKIPTYVKDGQFDVMKYSLENPKQAVLAQRFATAAKDGALETPEDALNVMKKALEPVNEAEGTASGVGLPNASTLTQLNMTPGWFQGKPMGLNELHDLRMGMKDQVHEMISKAQQWEVHAGPKVIKPLNSVASSVQKLITMTPPRELLETGMNPYSNNALEYVKEMASVADRTPHEVADIVNRFASADHLGKYNIYKKMINDCLEANARTLGTTVDQIPILAKMRDTFNNRLDNAFRNVPALPGEEIGDGTLQQLNTIEKNLGDMGPKPSLETITGKMNKGNFPLLDYRELAKATHALNFLHRKGLIGTTAMRFEATSDTLDYLMEQVWKPMNTFMKVSFGVRVAGEEAFLNMMREGWLSTAKGEMAAVAQRQDRKLDTVVARRAQAAAAGTDKGWSAVRDHIAQTAHAGMAKVAGALAPKEYREGAAMLTKYYGDRYLPQGFDGEHTVAGERAFWLKDSMLTNKPIMKEAEALKLNGVEGYKDTMYPSLDSWHKDLLASSKGPEFQAVLPIIKQTTGDLQATRKAVSDKLQEIYKSPEYREQYNTNPGFYQDPNFDISVQKMADKNAKQFVNQFTNAKAAPIHSLIDHTLETGVPDIEWIAHNVAAEDLPRYITEATIRAPGRWNTITSWSADHQGRVINFVSRRPIFVHAFTKELQNSQEMMSAWTRAFGADAAEKIWVERAYQNAWENSTGFVHNPELRSQFAEMHRNTLPFWFAQQQFIQRWGHAILNDPSVYRKAQLTMNGLRSVGFVHKDQNGEYFVYPGSQVMLDALRPVAKTVFGADVGNTFVGQFDGRIQMLSPGLAEGGAHTFIPGPGPLLTIPLKVMASRFPEMRKIEDAVDPFAKGKSVWEMVVPAWVSNSIKAMNADEHNSQFASAMRDQVLAMQSDPATALPESASPIQQQEFADKARQRARSIMLIRAVIGGASPASTPEYKYTNQLTQEFQTLVRETGDINEASNIFLQAHPNTTPADLLKNSIATTFQSQLAAKGTYIPPTAAVADFIQAHPEFIKKYGAAATYFLPWDKNGAFSQEAYNDELSSQLRIKRDAISDPSKGDLSGMVQESYIAKDAEYYYNQEHQYLKIKDALVGTGNAPIVKQLDLAWAALKANYLTTRPVFAQYLSQREERQQERANILQNLRAAMIDPTRPIGPHDAAVQEILNGYDNLLSVDNALAGRRDTQSTIIRKRANDAFVNFASNASDPIAKMVYSSLIKAQLRVA